MRIVVMLIACTLTGCLSAATEPPEAVDRESDLSDKHAGEAKRPDDSRESPALTVSSYLGDVPDAFRRIDSDHPRQVRIRNPEFPDNMPRGFSSSLPYHQQGIQKLRDGGFVISSSAPAGSHSYF